MTLETLAITFGQTLLPVATNAMRTISKELGKIDMKKLGDTIATNVSKALDFLKQLAGLAKQAKAALDPFIDSLGGWGKVIGAIALGTLLTKLQGIAGLAGGLKGTAGGLMGLKGALIAIAAVDFKKNVFDPAMGGNIVAAFKNAMLKYNPIVIPFTISVKAAKLVIPAVGDLLGRAFAGVSAYKPPEPKFDWSSWKQAITKGVFFGNGRVEAGADPGAPVGDGRGTRRRRRRGCGGRRRDPVEIRRDQRRR